MKTELCLMVKPPEEHCDASSAGPDLHVFYSDGKSEQTWTLSAGFLKPAFWVNTWRSGLTDLQLQCLYTQTGLENPHLKQIWILHCKSGVLPVISERMSVHLWVILILDAIYRFSKVNLLQHSERAIIIGWQLIWQMETWWDYPTTDISVIYHIYPLTVRSWMIYIYNIYHMGLCATETLSLYRENWRGWSMKNRSKCNFGNVDFRTKSTDP